MRRVEESRAIRKMEIALSQADRIMTGFIIVPPEALPN